MLGARREWIVMAAVFAIAIAAVAGSRLLARLDQTLYDAASVLWKRAPVRDIVIVGIDDPSLAAIGRWPWPRALHAALLERIAAAGPAAVGLDLILAEEDRENPEGDAALARAIKLAPTVLPVYAHGDAAGMREVLPAPVFRDAARSLAHIDAEIDTDGITRRVFLRQGIGAPAREHLSLALLRIARPQAIGETPGDRRPQRDVGPGTLVRDNRFAIAFAGRPGTFEQVSYAAVLRGEVPLERFAGRIVLVGATGAGLGDSYPTPVSGESTAMPGIEISANAIDAMLRGISIREAPPLTQLLVAPLAMVALLVAFLRMKPRGSLSLSLATALGAFALAALVFRATGYWFSPALVSIGALIAYPLWSWRRLEAANRYLAHELARIDEEFRVEPLAFREAQPEPAKALLRDRFTTKIDAAERAAEALRLDRRVFAQSIAGLPIAVLVCDRAERIILANAPAAALFGMDPGHAIGRSASELLGTVGTPVPGWRERFAQTCASGAAASDEIVAADDRHLLVDFAPYAFVEGVVVGVIVTLVDITPIRRLERERREFLQFVSHDLRSPQNSLIALGQLAQAYPDGFTVPKLGSLVEQYARDTLDLIDVLLAQSRAERLDAAQFVELDVGTVVRDAADDAWPLALAKQQEIDLALPDAPVTVRGSAELLMRAVQNLLTNAIKYSAERTRIHVSLDLDGGICAIAVRDQGRGIPAEALPKLFTRFYRVPLEAGTDPGGHGLGLAFVKTVASRHGGDVTVDSTPGVGSKFELSIPLVRTVADRTRAVAA